MPAAVTDDTFGVRLHAVLRGGSNPEKEDIASLRLGVVKQALTHASVRFAHASDERAMMSVFGAFYLLRPEDAPRSLIDPSTAPAIEGAVKKLSGRGDSGKARFLYELLRDARRAGAAPGDAKEAEGHLSDLEAFIRDTRKGRPIEVAGELERNAVSRVMLDPSRTAVEDAKVAISSWIDLGIQHNIIFKQTGRRPTQDEAVESTRALESGATTLVALHLRAGDIQGALEAIDSSSARRVIDPGFYRVLRAAARRDDGASWRTVFAELDQQAPERGGEIGISEEVLEAAFFNVALEAYRRDPADIASALDLARLLAAYGLSEGVPYVLADGLGRTPRPEDAALALRVLGAALDTDAEALDFTATTRTIAASDDLLAIASDALRAAPDAHPRVRDVLLQIGEIEIHAGHLPEARKALERAVRDTATGGGLLELAMVSRQIGDPATALEYASKAASVAGADPLDVADAETLGFELHRDAGQRDDAAKSLERALRAALLARRKQSGATTYRVKVERTMGRILAAYGENGAAGRAFDRALAEVSGDRALIGATLLRSMGFCLLTSDVDRARDTLRKGKDAGATEEDLVYAALWLMLLEKQNGVPADGSAADVFESAAGSPSWVGTLSSWALGRVNDSDLANLAQSEQSKVEASFYVAMRKRADAKALPQAGSTRESDASAVLKAVSRSAVLDVVEVDLARELTAPAISVPLPKGISIP
jgi:tetratricopeptide (TPR) repeat protein